MIRINVHGHGNGTAEFSDGKGVYYAVYWH